MGCLNSGMEGECLMFLDEQFVDIHSELGCDEDGNCLCEEDEEPELSCEQFQNEYEDDKEDD